jgi:hypothetical protein
MTFTLEAEVTGRTGGRESRAVLPEGFSEPSCSPG